MPCDKHTYRTNHEAIQAINGIAVKKGFSMKSYKCSDCGHFHIATNGKKKFRYVEQKYVMKPEDYLPIKHTKTVRFEPARKILNEPDFYSTLSTQKMLSLEVAAMLRNKINFSF